MTGLPLLLSVPGIARTAGSKKAFANPKTGKIIVTDDSGKRGANWKAVCAALARVEYAADPTRELLSIRLVFVLPRPKSHYRSGKRASELRDDAPYWAGKKPDATKLLRSIEDALTGIVWVDDAQVVAQHVSKVYGSRPGAYLIVDTIRNSEALEIAQHMAFWNQPQRRTA